MFVPKRKLQCAECGKEFWRYPSQSVGDGPFFCSNKCVAGPKRNGSNLKCAECGGEFYRRMGEQDVGVTVNQFCSRDCYQVWRDRSAKYYRRKGSENIHRIVAAAVLGRPLGSREVVHHIDENHQNNKPENFCVFPTQSDHARCHAGGMPPEEFEKYRLTNMASNRQ